MRPLSSFPMRVAWETPQNHIYVRLYRQRRHLSHSWMGTVVNAFEGCLQIATSTYTSHVIGRLSIHGLLSRSPSVEERAQVCTALLRPLSLKSTASPTKHLILIETQGNYHGHAFSCLHYGYRLSFHAS